MLRLYYKQNQLVEKIQFLPHSLLSNWTVKTSSLTIDAVY